MELINEIEFKHHVIKRLKHLSEITNSGALLMNKSLIKDPVQKVLVNFDEDGDWFSKTFMPIVTVSAIDCEKSSPGAGKVFLKLILNLLPDDVRKHLHHNLKHDYDSALKSLRYETDGVCDKADFELYKRQTLSLAAQELVNNILDLYDQGDQVIVKKSLSRNTLVSKELGYSFDNLVVDPIFLKNGAWKRKNVNTVLIDGIIENVSEIHHLLTQAYENKEPYLIICSGILPEPKSVVIQNFARNTIDMVVASIKSDEFNIQALVDFGTVCMTEPVSALKGDTISQATTRGLKKVEAIEITRDTTNIKNSIAKRATDKLLSEVIERSSKNHDVAHLYQHRVKCLTSSRVNVAIGLDDSDREKSIVEDVDVFFRSCPLILRQGFIKKIQIKTLPERLLCLLFEETDVQPAHRIEKALESYISILEQVSKTGKVISNTRE